MGLWCLCPRPAAAAHALAGECAGAGGGGAHRLRERAAVRGRCGGGASKGRHGQGCAGRREAHRGLTPVPWQSGDACVRCVRAGLPARLPACRSVGTVLFLGFPHLLEPAQRAGPGASRTGLAAVQACMEAVQKRMRQHDGSFLQVGHGPPGCKRRRRRRCPVMSPHGRPQARTLYCGPRKPGPSLFRALTRPRDGTAVSVRREGLPGHLRFWPARTQPRGRPRPRHPGGAGHCGGH